MAMTSILDCIEYGAGSCRNEDMIIELQARAEAAEQKLREIAQFTLKTNTRAEAAEAKAARLEKALASLFDAQYGVAYHHCGDGDGLTPEEAAEIVALVREIAP